MGSLPSRSLYGAVVEILDLIADAVHAALLAQLAAASPDDPFRHDEEVHIAASALADMLPSTLGRWILRCAAFANSRCEGHGFPC